jgi:hypothetical protein
MNFLGQISSMADNDRGWGKEIDKVAK